MCYFYRCFFLASGYVESSESFCYMVNIILILFSKKKKVLS